ncbi:MAG: phosphohydrolase [Planctomycetota bacterium]|nr:MAG: phosphohydrolase [Planctomycetota bacterium]
MQSLDELLNCYAVRGYGQYGGEAVSQLQHACQCAQLAEAAGASPSLVAAAFLHDLGHLLHNLGDHCADRGVDDAHELRAVRALSPLLPASVTAPIALHVEAKRYLVATDAGYADCLSPASITSLQLQGGPMSAAEVSEFVRRPHASDALALRRWDDIAKNPENTHVEWVRYRRLISSLA